MSDTTWGDTEAVAMGATQRLDVEEVLDFLGHYIPQD